MEPQLHHTHGRHYDDPLHSAGADVHDEDENGVEKHSAVNKVKAKAEKLKATIKHGHGHHDEENHDDAKTMNESPAVRSGLVQPTNMGQSVLAEDLHATHSDIVDPPVRSFAQWEEEERHGAPPPLSTGVYTDLSQVDHHRSGRDANREHLKSSIGKSPNPTAAVAPANHQTEVTDPTKTGGKEAGITEVLRSSDKMAIYEEPYYKSSKSDQNEPNVYTGSHDQFAPEPVENVPLNTGVYTDLSQVGHHDSGRDVNREQLRGSIGKSTGMEEDPSAPNPTKAVSPANYQTKVTDPTKTGGKEAGITEVLRSFDKMASYDEPYSKSTNEPEVYTESQDQFAPKQVENAAVNTVAGDPSGHSSIYTEQITSTTSPIADKAAAAKELLVSKLGSSGENRSETNTKSSFPTNYAHKVADTVTGTLGPVYEKVVGTGNSVMSKMQGSGQEEKGVWVKDYLVKPGDEDKALSEVITNAFHRGKETEKETDTKTCIYGRDEGEGRRQDSAN